MTYDAVLTARRGMGVEELRLATAPFAAAVRWALFAETVAPRIGELRSAVAVDPPKGLAGAELMAFIGRRGEARTALAELELALYPPDEDLSRG